MSEGTFLGDSTIVAVATPPGRGGIGVVRLSGQEAFRIVNALSPAAVAFESRVVRYTILRSADGHRIDDALITCFPAPHSYTGEDVVEIATHGSPVVQDWLVRACVEHGAMLARPGEFTERAFLSGRMDLTGAEAVRDLIEAQTLAQARLAAEQMGGSIAAAIRPVKQSLLELIATLEAGIDFAEDDIDVMPGADLSQRLQEVLKLTARLLASFTHGRLLRDGLRLAIVGEPNVGKSSLFNRLVEQERAIVTARPGTTRDIITERIALNGIPVELLDTAGLRETDDEAERIGVMRSRQAIAEADAVLVVVDASSPFAFNDDAYASLTGRPVLLVQNKIDLLSSSRNSTSKPAGKDEEVVAEGNPLVSIAPGTAWPSVQTSTVTGQGVAELKQAILTLATGGLQHAGSATLTNLRQQQAVSRAHAALLRAEQAVAQSTPHEMILIDLYEALQAQDELTGETTPDDVLDLIFSTFCIGK